MDPGYLLPLQAGAPAADPSLRQQLRRLALKRYGLGEDDSADPVRAIETPGGTGLYHTSQIADASVDHSPETNWKRRKTQAIIDAAIAGLGGLDPRSGGLSGFLGSAAQAAGRVRGAFDARMAEQEPQGPPIPAEMLKYAFGEDRQPTEFEQYQADPQGYARFKQAGLKPEAPPTGQLHDLVGPKGPGVYRVVPGQPPEYVGGIVPSGTSQADNPAKEKIKIGAQTAVAALDKIEALLEKDPNADVTTLMASLGHGVVGAPVIGKMIGGAGNYLEQQGRTPTQQEFQAAINEFAHSAVGLLPGSRQSLTLFNSMVDAYRPVAGESAESRAAKRDARRKLRARLARIAETGDEPGEAELLAPPGVAPAMIRRPDPSPEPSVPRPQNTTSPTVNPADWFRPRSTP